MAFLPASCELRELAVAASASRADPDSTVCVLMHEYDFRVAGAVETGFDMTRFEKLLANFASGSLAWASFQDCLGGDCGVQRARANQTLRRALKSPFRRFARKGTGGVYWTTDMAMKKARLLRLLNRAFGIK